MNNIKDKLINLLSVHFKVPIKDVHNIEFGKTTEWDSMNHLKMILEIEKNFNLKVEENSYSEIINFTSIYNYIQSKLK